MLRAILLLVLLSTPVLAAPKLSVQAQIRAKAAEEWPGDYVMQKYVIDQQTKAYNALPKLRIPAEIRSLLLLKAQKEWPGDYVMQKYVIEQQVKAYEALRG